MALSDRRSLPGGTGPVAVMDGTEGSTVGLPPPSEGRGRGTDGGYNAAVVGALGGTSATGGRKIDSMHNNAIM